MPATPSVLDRPARPAPQAQVLQGSGVSGNPIPGMTMAGSAAVYKNGHVPKADSDRHGIAKRWQIEAYRQAQICGEARYSAALFSAMAGRAEIGISEPQGLGDKAVWVNTGPEVDALAEVAATVRERTALIRSFMLHWTIAGECYLIARDRVENDPGYVGPPLVPGTEEPYNSWADYIVAETERIRSVDLYDTQVDLSESSPLNPNTENPIWEVVAVTEIRRQGRDWQVRHDEDNWLNLRKDDPIIRMWNPDPERRREAWSPFKAMETTLREIEWLTRHIFTQVRSRLMAAGVWFLPDNLTFAPPPSDAAEGGAEAIAEMNEAEQFMLSLSHASMGLLDGDTVAMPTIVMADPTALAAVDQAKLIQFWSELDDKAMIMRSDAVRRFALGMDLPPEQVLGSSGLAVTGAGGSAGSVNHWGVWANEEQTISAHIEPALDAFVGILTSAYLRLSVEDTALIVAYDTTSLRLRQDRSKEALELYDRGLISAKVAVKEVGFDPTADMMGEPERKMWLLTKIVSGSFAPEQMAVALKLLTGLEVPSGGEVSGNTGQDGRQQSPNNDDHPYQGPPRVDHENKQAPFSAQFGPTAAAAEVLVLRALEKNGNRLLNDGKRGREKTRMVAAHSAHVAMDLDRTVSSTEFDFTLANEVLPGFDAKKLARFCADLTNSGVAYKRELLLATVKGLN